MATINDILDHVDAIIFDFDGPVCSVFARHPASGVAHRMRVFLSSVGVSDLAPSAQGPNPLRVLKWTYENYPDLTKQVEDVLCAEELAAVVTAEPTPFAREAIAGAHASGRLVAIVSNNSARAINEYLAMHELKELVTPVVGRTYGVPTEMKPNPISLQRAILQLEIRPQTAVFVGDSPTDMEAAVLAGTWALAYAKSEDRRAVLESAGADAVIDEIRTLAVQLGAG
jgi:phosphoglycolate phosphatase-like HAD superfamily hydrolase